MVKKSKIKVLLFLMFSIGIVVSLHFISKPNEVIDMDDSIVMENKVVEPTPTSELQEKIEEMHGVNDEVLGWIKVGKTVIDYPLLQGDDNDYYLKHNYKKKRDGWGEIFIDYQSDLKNAYSNIVVYGHNNGGNKSITTKFSTLQLYNDKEHYENNSTISITTLEGEIVYDIFAVFKSRVFYKDEVDVFRFYNYIDLSDKDIFEEYVKNVKESALYETDITPEYGDQLITLITCDYTQKNGRFIVVGRRRVEDN